jgi:hypothetical protein
MKNSYLLLLSFCIIIIIITTTTTLSAQIVKDSTWHYDGWEVHPNWDLARKTYYTYNSDEQIIQEITYSTFIKFTENFAKKDYFYNEDGLLSKIESYVWLSESSEWEITTENYYEYDEENHITKDEVLTYDNSTVTSGTRNTYSYNGFGDLTWWRYHYYSFGSWYEDARDFYVYDENQNVLEIKQNYSNFEAYRVYTYTYDELNRRMTGILEVEYAYDLEPHRQWIHFYTNDQLFPDSILTQASNQDTWNTGIWDNLQMNHYNYDANGNLLEDIELLWDEATTDWENKYLRNYTYDSQNNETERILQNHNTGTWQNKSRRSNIFNSLGFSLDEYKNQRWHQDNLEWYDGGHYLKGYNEDGYLLERIDKKWDTGIWDYRNLIKDIHFWTGLGSTNNSEQFQRSENWTFPNPYPIGSPIVLEDFNPNEIYQFKVYDLTGKLVHRRSFTGSQNLRLNHQMTKGNYIFLISDRNDLLLVEKVVVY